MMDRCISPNSSLACLYHDELGLHEEFRHCLLYTAELEVAVLSAKEEVAKRDFEILHLKDVLGSTIRERNEAQSQCHKLLLEKLLLQQHLLQLQQQQQEKDQDHHQRRRRDAPLALAAGDHQDETKAADSSNSQRFNYNINSLDDACNQKIKEASRFADPDDVVEKEEEEEEEEEDVEEQVLIQLAGDRPLPEKGQLLQAVKEAGPLLHTLLLAGPLPQWQHPPPQLNSIDIPPITVSVSVSVSSTTNISSPSFPILTPRRIFDQDSFNSSNAASSACCFSKKRGLEQLYCSTRDLDSSSPPPPPPPPPLPPNSNKHQKKAVASYCSDLH